MKDVTQATIFSPTWLAPTNCLDPPLAAGSAKVIRLTPIASDTEKGFQLPAGQRKCRLSEKEELLPEKQEICRSMLGSDSIEGSHLLFGQYLSNTNFRPIFVMMSATMCLYHSIIYVLINDKEKRHN